MTGVQPGSSSAGSWTFCSRPHAAMIRVMFALAGGVDVAQPFLAGLHARGDEQAVCEGGQRR
ncbi:hypothetical protein ACFQ0G_53500 [Streptomyces chiangmaiensis]|uniref:hypothetical protein n=1 Tax=Streptomyces chiangmaiensis TaxID=766497 RepID=UPI0031EF42F0